MIPQLTSNPLATISLARGVLLFFAVAFTVFWSLLTIILISSEKRPDFAGFLKLSGIAALIATMVGLPVTLLWLSFPRHYDYSEVIEVAKPGVHISEVIKTLGRPAESYPTAGGAQTFLYAEGTWTGYTSIDTNAKGVIVRVDYVD